MGFNLWGEEDPKKTKKKEEKAQSEYQQSLFAYNKSLVEKDEKVQQFRQIVQPFQLVVESDPDDYAGGLGDGIKKSREKMSLAIGTYMKLQVAAKDQWPIDTFANHHGKLCHGITLYLLTEEEMHQLEEILHNGLD